MKYKFIEQPPNGEFGVWKTEDGFKCFTDKRSSAVNWYKQWLKKNKK